jgi:(1->4)-alpha-D-glucan 1-alpha-D-glucosylmutase
VSARPEHAYLPPAVVAGRTWGFGVNLYALRSQRNWGIGDFTDLGAIVDFAKTVGAGVVGCSPLHALHYVDPEAASPYSPTTRYFRNPIYIDVEAVPEFHAPNERAATLRERVLSPAFAAMLAGLRAERYVAYARVARAKYSALGECYAILRDVRGDRLKAFGEFVERGGERLETFALYDALTEHFATNEGRTRGWMTWPSEYHDRRGEAAVTWGVKNRRRVEYFKYLQFLIDEQLAAVAARTAGMAIGLYLDLAVGVDVNSADVWSDPSAYVLDETVGAPPDQLGPFGQDWGLPPHDPAAMLRDDGRAFAELLEANMAHAGALRLDHVMALLRLFRIKRGHTPADGLYHEYPFEELLGIATRQSYRKHCLIVGEDLGNVPHGFRERMEREAIFSYRVLLFEREPDGSFKYPPAYPAIALATATTHDVPTLAGWALGRDIDVRERIGHASPEAAELQRNDRRVDASRLLETLRASQVLDDAAFHATHRNLDERNSDGAAYGEFVRAAYAYLASSPARLVLVQLDDILGEVDQVNLPGTFVEYPNWRRKNTSTIEAIATDDRLTAFAAEMRRRVVGEREESRT